MTTGDYNPSTSRIPGGLTEADLLAIVEGETLPADRAALVAKTLAAQPAMARELDAMKRDRAGLRSLGDEAAPAGLIDAVGAALQPVFERQMLLGLAEGEAVHEGPPVSMVLPRRNALFGGNGRKLALAAGLALVAGGVAFTAMSMSHGPKGPALPTPPGPIAYGTPAKETPALVVSPAETRREVAIAKDAEDHKPLAMAKAIEDPPVGPPAALADDADTGAPALASTASTTSDGADIGPLPPASMELSQALALASDHRLVIRVITADGRFDRVTDRLVHARGAWQLAGSAPAALASILDPQSGQPLPEGAVPDRTRITGIEGGHDAIDLPGPPAPPEFASVSSVYVLSTRLDEATLKSLDGAMRDIGADVVFEEATQPLPMDGSPVTAPSAVVWWGSNPSGWAAWGSVPVVIQR